LVAAAAVSTWQAVRVMRAEPSRFADATARSVGAVWRAYDLQLTTYAALLGVIGLLMAYTNSVEAGQSVMDSGTIFARALMWSALAIVVFVVATAFDYRWLKTLVWPIYFVNLGLLVLTLAIGDGVGGSARWVSIGPLTFQFSELAKILMITVLGVYLGNREGRLDSLGSVLGACLLMAPAVVLVMMQPDLGSSLVFAAILAGMLFMSGASLRWLIAMGTGVAIAVLLSWTYVLRDYQQDLIASFFSGATDSQGSGWQVLQSQITVGSGGLLGTGLTNGTQTRGEFCPSRRATSCSRCWRRSWGSSGPWSCSCCSALMWRILTCAWRSRDPFGTLFGAGLATMLLFQVFVNVGMVIGSCPSRASVAVHQPRRRVAGEHRDRPRRAPKRQHPPATAGGW
jgi:rod shape determining protein RodA